MFCSLSYHSFNSTPRRSFFANPDAGRVLLASAQSMRALSVILSSSLYLSTGSSTLCLRYSLMRRRSSLERSKRRRVFRARPFRTILTTSRESYTLFIPSSSALRCNFLSLEHQPFVHACAIIKPGVNDTGLYIFIMPGAIGPRLLRAPVLMPRKSFCTSEACKKFSEKNAKKVASMSVKKSFRPPTSPNIAKMSETTRFYFVTFLERLIIAMLENYLPGKGTTFSVYAKLT